MLLGCYNQYNNCLKTIFTTIVRNYYINKIYIFLLWLKKQNILFLKSMN